MTPALWRLVAALAPYRLRGLPERVLWGMGWVVRVRREARA